MWSFIFQRSTINCQQIFNPRFTCLLMRELCHLKTGCRWLTYVSNKPGKYGMKFSMLMNQNMFTIFWHTHLQCAQFRVGSTWLNVVHIELQVCNKMLTDCCLRKSFERYSSQHSIKLLRCYRKRNLSWTFEIPVGCLDMLFIQSVVFQCSYTWE